MVPHELLVNLDRLAPTDRERSAQAAANARPSTHVLPWRGRDASAFNVALVMPADGAPVGNCVFPMSHDYRIDRMVLSRLEVLADITRHRVIAVETPGVTMAVDDPAGTPRSHVKLKVIWAAALGDYSEVARLQRAAVEETTGVDVAGCRIVGESLGAQLGASLAAICGRVQSLDLIEPVNCRPLTLRALIRLQRALVGLETDRKTAYVGRNGQVGWGEVQPFELSSSINALTDRRLKAFHRQGRFVAPVALGLRRGLTDALNGVDPKVSLRLWRGDASAVCQLADAEWLAGQLSSQAKYVDILTLSAPRSWPNGIGHHALTDLDLMFAFSRSLRRAWDLDDSGDLELKPRLPINES